MLFKHQFSRMAHCELKWLLPDLEETYRHNLKNNYSKLEENNWIEYNSFTYKFNNLGFRSQNVGDKNLLVVGCSFTFGIGVPFEKIWAYKVADHLKLNCLNYGVPGASAYSSFRIAYHTLKTLKPNLVLFLCPPNDRMPVYSNEYMYDIGPWVFGNNQRHYQYVSKAALEYYNEYIMFDENLLLQEEMSRLSLRKLCENQNIKYIDLYLKDFEFIDLARDLSHPGIKSHLLFSKFVLRLI